MAWVRTATSLITFGFTIYKFFQYMRQQNPEHLEPVLNPRRFALVLISLGIVSLALATWQHQRDMVWLRSQHPEVPYSLATVLAGLISLFGVLALLAVVFRI
jgi:putative membrane protein